MTFQHTPITQPGKEIRLIQLLRDENEENSPHPNSGIHVRLLHVVGDCKYRAVSYVWGSDEKTEAITVNGKAYGITENLHVLLLRLQGYVQEISDPDAFFWIDAICINQNDVKEKGKEVGNMGNVYSKAVEVVCWLGPADETNDSNSVMDDFDNLGRKAIERGYFDIADYEKWLADMFDIQKWPENEISDSWERKLIAETKIGVQNDADLNPLNIKPFMRRSYFYRVWIYQEMTLGYSQTFLCGNKVITGDRLEAAMLLYCCTVFSKLFGFFHNKVTAQEAINMGIEASDMQYLIVSPMVLRCTWRTNPRRELLEILAEFLRCDCGVMDPRDRVFGTWGMLDRSQDYGISPDYTLSTAQVYSRTAKYLIQRHGTSIMMLCHGQGNNVTLGLPSWVPDFTMSRHYNRDMPVSFLFKSHVDHSFVDTDTESVLRVQGIRLDQIKHCAKPLNVQIIAKLASFMEHPGKEKLPSEKLTPHLFNFRTVSHASRHLWIQMNQWLKDRDFDDLLAVLFRILADDEEFVEDMRNVLISMVSRDPLIALHLLSLKEVNTPSSEYCSVCTGDDPFKNHLEALICPHLPVLYDSLDDQENQDLFVYENYRNMRQKADVDDAEGATFNRTFGIGFEYASSWARFKLSDVELFVTENGDLGYCSGSVRNGDEIFLVGDSWSLYALRPSSSSGTYSFCGQAYADSIYEGSSLNPLVQGTGSRYPRGITTPFSIITASLENRSHPVTPFFALYDLNPGLIQDIQIV